MNETIDMKIQSALFEWIKGSSREVMSGSVEVRGTSEAWDLGTETGTFTNITQTLHTTLTIGRARQSSVLAPTPKTQSWPQSSSCESRLMHTMTMTPTAFWTSNINRKLCCKSDSLTDIMFSFLFSNENDNKRMLRKVFSCCWTCCYLLFIVVREVETLAASIRARAPAEPEPGIGG